MNCKRKKIKIFERKKLCWIAASLWCEINLLLMFCIILMHFYMHMLLFSYIRYLVIIHWIWKCQTWHRGQNQWLRVSYLIWNWIVASGVYWSQPVPRVYRTTKEGNPERVRGKAISQYPTQVNCSISEKVLSQKCYCSHLGLTYCLHLGLIQQITDMH